MGVRLRPGKLPNSLLKQMLKGLRVDDPRVLIGPGVGEDAAHISFGGVTLIAKADPVTFATDLIGWYAVNVNANDVAASGGTPRWFLATVLLPEGIDSGGAAAIFNQVKEAADELGVEVIGGHTEVTIGLPRPIVCGAMLGEAPASKAVSTSGAKVGDSVVLTRGIAIEGTSIVAREMPERLMAAGVGQDVIDRSANYLFDPGISVVAAARVAMESGGVTGMHDPTEGGLATALWEVAEACGHGLECGCLDRDGPARNRGRLPRNGHRPVGPDRFRLVVDHGQTRGRIEFTEASRRRRIRSRRHRPRLRGGGSNFAGRLRHCAAPDF